MPKSKKLKDVAVVSDWSEKGQVLSAASRDGLRLQYASSDCLNDREVVFAAVKQNGLALEFASQALRSDKEVVLEAVHQTGQALQFASEELKHDKDVILQAVSKHGICLAMTSEALQGDREVVLRAVSQQGIALRYASDELRADKSVVLAAIAQMGTALKYANADIVDDGFMRQARPFLQQLYIFKATMLSGHLRMAVLRPHHTKSEISRLCMESLRFVHSPRQSEVLLGSNPLLEGSLEQISSLAPGQLYEVQVVFLAQETDEGLD